MMYCLYFVFFSMLLLDLDFFLGLILWLYYGYEVFFIEVGVDKFDKWGFFFIYGF